MEKRRRDFINSVNLNAETDFPYLAMEVIGEQSYPRNPGFQVMHWHEDLQLIYVLEDGVEIRTLDTSVHLCANEGIFINKNIVHRVVQSNQCHYYSFIFPERLLAFYPGGPAQRLVNRIVGTSQLSLFCLSPDGDWQERALSILRCLVQLEQQKTVLYPYEVLVRLSELCLEMQKNITLPAERRPSVIEARMQSFLRYIEEHYAEQVSLEQLAQSAHVSKSECLRCFRQTLQTTPYKYLSEFRLSVASQLLRETDEPISSIAAKVGFQHPSHFGKCFREKTGLSPKEYRKS